MDWVNVCFNASAFVAGLFVLEFGADRFVDHTAVVARRLGVSPTLVALLTAGAEWEELAVILAATAQHRAPLALGNILGSSISNILGAFSLGLLFLPSNKTTHFDRSSKIYSAVLLVLTTLYAGAILFVEKAGTVLGVGLVVVFGAYVASVAWGIYRGVVRAPEDSDSDSDSDDSDSSDSDSDSDEEEEEVSEKKRTSLKMKTANGYAPVAVSPKSVDINIDIESAASSSSSTLSTDSIPLTTPLTSQKSSSPRPPIKNKRPRSLTYHVIQLIFGLLALSLSGFVLSYSITSLASAFSLSSTLLGATILSFATTLPEKLVSITSSRKGENGIVVANTAGSNIFLLTLCSGVLFLTAGAQGRGKIARAVTLWEVGVMWLSAALFTGVIFAGGRRWMGWALAGAYVVFIVGECVVHRGGEVDF